MKTCPYCAEEIQDAAIVCKHCGRQLDTWKVPPSREEWVAKAEEIKRSDQRYRSCAMWVLGLMGLALILLFLWGAMVEPRDGQPSEAKMDVAASPPDQVTPEVRRMVEEMERSGLLMNFWPQRNRAEVDPRGWSLATLGQERLFAAGLADHCHVDSGLLWVDVYDGYSGERLAKFDSWGFKGY